MRQEQNISIKIANQRPVAMTIRPDQEEIIRRAEKGVNELWQSWSRRFSDRKPIEVLALVAFQYARYYYEAEAADDAVAHHIESFEAELDRLLGQIPAALSED